MVETISPQPQAPEIDHEALAEYVSSANDRHMDAREQMSADLATIGGQPVAKEIAAHSTSAEPAVKGVRAGEADKVAADIRTFDLKITNYP